MQRSLSSVFSVLCDGFMWMRHVRWFLWFACQTSKNLIWIFVLPFFFFPVRLDVVRNAVGFYFGRHMLAKMSSIFASGDDKAAEIGYCIRRLVRWCVPFLEFTCKDLDTLTSLLFSLKHQENCVSGRFCIYFCVPAVNFYVANFFV